MGLRKKSYSKEIKQSATSSQIKKGKNPPVTDICNYLRDYISQWWARNKEDTGKFHYIFCPLTSFSIQLFSPFLLLSVSANSIDSLQAEQKFPPIIALKFLSIGNRETSNQDFLTNSYCHHNSAKHYIIYLKAEIQCLGAFSQILDCYEMLATYLPVSQLHTLHLSDHGCSVPALTATPNSNGDCKDTQGPVGNSWEMGSSWED